MKKKILFILLIPVVVFISFVFYQKFDYLRYFFFPGNKIRIELDNESGFNIDTIKIFNNETGSFYQGVKNEDNTIIYFEKSGESTYYLNIIFENGKSLKSNTVYVEPGYSMKETVYSDSISTQYMY